MLIGSIHEQSIARAFAADDIDVVIEAAHDGAMHLDRRVLIENLNAEHAQRLSPSPLTCRAEGL